MSTQFRVLGPVEVWADGDEITPPGRLQRRLIAALLGTPTGLSNAALCDLLWGHGDLDARLHLLVHRTRGLLDRADRLERTADGYRLALTQGELDLDGLDLRADEQPAEALTMVAADAFRDCDGEFFDTLREGLSERLAGVRKRALRTAFDRGEDDVVLQNAGDARRREPYDEELAEIHMATLARGGRGSDALEIYDALRRRLADELGVDPGRALQELHMQLVSDAVGAVRAVPNQLPPHSVDLLGREETFSTLDTMLENGPRIAVVTGTGGVGKTSVAMAWAARVRERFSDGILYVDLHGFGTADPVDPVVVLVTFLRALGRPVSSALGVDELSATLRSVTDRRSLLIILDNAHDEAQVRPLLPAAEGPVVVVTSREALPGVGVRAPALDLRLEPLTASAATALVGAQLPGLDTGLCARLAEKCARLPLAIMVASRAATAGGRDNLFDDLGRSRVLDALETGDAESDLATVLSWSLDDLDAPSRRLFCLLGLVSSPTTAHTIIALDGGEPGRVRSTIRRLQRANLIFRADSTRLTMHDLLRELAAHLGAEERSADELREARTRLLTHLEHGVRDFTEHMYPLLGQTPVPMLDDRPETLPVMLSSDALPPAFRDVAQAREWVGRELPLMTEVISAAGSSDDEQIVRMVLRLRGYAMAVGQLPRAHLSLFHQLRSRARRLDDRFVEATALRLLGAIGFIHEGVSAARGWTAEAADISRADGDELRVGLALINLGQFARYVEEYDEALGLFAEATVIHERIEEWSPAALSTSSAALVHIARGDYARGEAAARRSVRFAERGTNTVIRSEAYACLALALIGLDRIEEARRVRGDAAVDVAIVEVKELTAMVMLVDARLHIADGDLDAAVTQFNEIVRFSRDAGGIPELRVGWLGLADVHRLRGDADSAEKAQIEADRVLSRLRDGAS